MKVVLESTVLVDTVSAPVINSFVADIWKNEIEPAGTGRARAIHVSDRFEDIRR